MHAGEDEVKQHKKLYLVRVRPWVAEVVARDKMILVVLVVFHELNAQEKGSNHLSDNQPDHQLIDAAKLGRIDRESHKQTAAEQHSRIDSAHRHAELATTFDKRGVIQAAINNEGEKDRSKE